jgi:hypothetical protein
MPRSRIHRLSACLLALCLVSTPAVRAAGFGVSADAGTPGVGAALWFPLAGSFLDFRVGFNTLSFNHAYTSGGIRYDGHAVLRNVPLLVDWYPVGFGFRLTGGVVYNDNQATLVATPQDGSYTIDGTTYPASQAGPLTGSLTYPHLAPYLGFGFGDPFSGILPVFFSVDFGAFYQRSGSVTLVDPHASGNPSLAAGIAAEQAHLEASIGRYRWYPVVSLGLGFTF